MKKVQLTGNNFTQKGLHDLTRRLGDVEDKKVIMIMMEQSNHIKKSHVEISFHTESLSLDCDHIGPV